MQLPFWHGEDKHSSISVELDNENNIYSMCLSYEY